MGTRGRRAGVAGATEAAGGLAAALELTGDLFGPPEGSPARVPVPARRPPAPPGPPRPPGPTPSLAPAARAAATPAARHLWLALRCTDLPLAAVGFEADDPPPEVPQSAGRRASASRGAPASRAVPCAVVDGTHARRLVVACNASAAAQGIRPGLALNAAHALAPGLDVREREPWLEERRLRGLARWATAYTPFVSLEPPDTLLLEVRGSLRLFGGAAALIERALRELAAHGHRVAHALAPTPRGALWLARSAPGTLVESPARLPGALATLPVGVPGWSERTCEQLARLGVRTLGELRRLPRDGLARRFEGTVLAELDEAFGAAPAPRRRHVVPERFHERVELTCELESLAHMEPAIDRLLDRMGRFLRVRDAGVQRIALTFVHRGGRTTCVPLGRGTPCGEAREWRLLVRERLGRLELPAAALALQLRTSVVLPLTGSSEALPGFAVGQAQANAGALLDRLRARLGDAAVNGVCLVPEHRPERAWRRVTPRATPAPAVASARAARRRSRAPADEPQLPATPRPLWLLAEPERLRIHQGQPCHDGFLRFEAGPERIESGWWDGRDVARDYYVATTRAGVRLWIYREREPGREAWRWYLHGVFG
jgi:protein ImuB